MAIDIETVDSPGWWMYKLWKKLEERRPHYQQMMDRYDGEAPVPESLQDAPEAAQKFFKTSRTRFAEMIVKAVLYPLKIQSVSTSQSNSDVGDAAAFELLRRSGMFYESKAVHRAALVTGRSYAIVSRYTGRTGKDYGPRFTSEDPREVVTIQDPVVQSETLAGFKITHDELDERDYCYLYLPGRVYRASKESTSSQTMPRFDPGSYDWDEDYGGISGRALPGLPDEVAVIPYRDEEGVGEFARHTELLDRIDHMVLQGMVIATYQAFKQRGIKAAPEDMPDFDPDTGEPIDYDDIFSADPGALWKLPATAEMWESGAVDLTPIWTGIDRDIQKLSAVTFTPLSMFSPEGQNQSAEGANLTREGRTFKIEDRQESFAESHEKALSLLLQLDNQSERADIGNLKVLWRPAERHSLASKASAMSQTRGDIPFRTRMIHIWQMTPEEADEAERLRDQELMMMAAMEAQTQLGATPELPGPVGDPREAAPEMPRELMGGRNADRD